jgi:hypothetical protein
MSTKRTPVYGNITIHENTAGLVYMRFVEDNGDGTFRGRVMDPSTMRALRWTAEDVTASRCLPHAVGLPVAGWGRLDQIKKVCRTVKKAKEMWNSVHWGPTQPKQFA